MTESILCDSGLTILVVEDEPTIALLERKALERGGHTVITADTCAAALDMLHESGMVDVALLDNQLPDMNGSELLNIIRRQYPTIPCVMVTGNGDEQLAAEIIKSGASDYIVKDYQSDYLKSLPRTVSRAWEQTTLLNAKKRAEAALALSEKRYRNLVESTDIVAREYDWKEQRFTYVSETAVKKYGYPISEWMKKGFWADHIYEEDRKEALDFCHSAAIRGEDHDFEYRLLHASGEPIWVRDIISVEMLENRPVTLRGFLVDISEHKRMEETLRESEERYRALSESAFEGVGVAQNGVLFETNNVLAEMLGYTKDEMTGRSYMELTAPEYRERVAQVIKTNDPRPYELMLLRKDGTTFAAEVHGSAIPYRGGTARISAVRDISQRRQKEIELREAKEAAEAATKLKDKFVSLVAHDLRSPFGSLVSFLRMLKNDPEIKIPPSTSTLMDSMLATGDQLLEMIAQLLDISRLQTGSISLKSRFCDGHEIAIRAIGAVSHLAAEKDITLNNLVPAGSRLYADPTLYERVILNLLSNAVKFCNAGDKITVSLCKNNIPGLAVHDTGPGVSPDLLADLFRHEIKTTSPGSMGESGTGLGLPYCNDIMTAHNGSLSVESSTGAGASFCAHLPMVKPVVLVVDDKDDQRFMIRSMLKDIDVTIVEAANGNEAVAAITEQQPHLIISDLNMPQMGGFDLIKWIHSEMGFSEIPIIITTSDKEIETRNKVFRLGANDFITKPIDKKELIPRVRQFIR